MDDAGTEEPTEEGDDLDFSSLKKKKKRVIDEQVAALDAQLEEAGIVDDKDQVEGEDPFKTEGEDEVATATEEEGWLKSDRDYTYEEVYPRPLLIVSFYIEYSVFFERITRPLVSERKSRSHPPSSSAKAPNEPSLQTFTTNLSVSTVISTISKITSLLNSEQQAVSTDQTVSFSRVDFNKNN